MFNETKELIVTDSVSRKVRIIPILGVFCVQYTHGCTSVVSSGFDTREEAERYIESRTI